MPNHADNAAQVRSILRDAIQNGVYPPGSALPSTRELAAQFKINRNTASKIYHELAVDHVIELGTNRPPTVSKGLSTDASKTLRQRLRENLEPLLLESRLIGMSPEDIQRELAEIAEELLANDQRHTIYLAECNMEEALSYAQELTLKLGLIVQPVLLSQLSNGFEADVIVTPYFHLQEARDVLGNNEERLLGLVVTADSSDIARVASMVSRGPLGVVAVNLHAAARLRRLLRFQMDVPMMIATTDLPETVLSMRDEVECVVCTMRSYSDARKQISDTPITLVQYHADEQSIQHIRRQILRLTNSRSPALT